MVITRNTHLWMSTTSHLDLQPNRDIKSQETDLRGLLTFNPDNGPNGLYGLTGGMPPLITTPQKCHHIKQFIGSYLQPLFHMMYDHQFNKLMWSFAILILFYIFLQEICMDHERLEMQANEKRTQMEVAVVTRCSYACKYIDSHP